MGKPDPTLAGGCRTPMSSRSQIERCGISPTGPPQKKRSGGRERRVVCGCNFFCIDCLYVHVCIHIYICLYIYMFVIRYYTYTWGSDHKIVCCILLLCFEVPEELIFINCEKPALHTCRIQIYLLCISIN